MVKKRAGRPKKKLPDDVRNINFPFAISKKEKAWLKEQAEKKRAAIAEQGIELEVTVAMYIRENLFKEMPADYEIPEHLKEK